MQVKPYHMRRTDKQITKKAEIIGILMRQNLMTIAMCKSDQPYLVTVDFLFDKKTNCFYFHCASKGKKNEYLKANPKIWGEVVEDHGYVQGNCEHGYRCVHFEGVAEFIDEIDEKKKVLELMIEKMDDNPDQCKKDSIMKSKLKKVAICKIKAKRFTGKESLPKK